MIIDNRETDPTSCLQGKKKYKKSCSLQILKSILIKKIYSIKYLKLKTNSINSITIFTDG